MSFLHTLIITSFHRIWKAPNGWRFNCLAGGYAGLVNRAKGTFSKVRLVRATIQSEEDIWNVYQSLEASIRKAARQLPRDDSGLIYLKIGRRSRGRVKRLLEMADLKLPGLFKDHQRVAGIVIAIMDWSDVPGGAVYTVENMFVVNNDARNPLPEDFVVVGSHALTFGEDIMRAHPKGSFRLVRGW